MKDKIIVIFLVALILVLWEATINIFKIPPYLIPPLREIINAIITNFESLIYDTLVTAFESLLGFLIAGILSTIVAIYITYSKTASRIILPFLIGLKAIPLIAIAPLLILWFGIDIFSKAIMAAIISFFPIVVNLIRGLKDVDHEHIELLKSFSATNFQIFKYLRVPNALPFFMAGLKIASTLSVVGAIVGETVGASEGIGHLILVSSLRIETAMVFAGILFASILGIIFYYSINTIEKRFIFWRNLND
ncbi:MAG: ABC transporter permease [Ignavibacteriales bacterium]|nr:MAG: ABC transporter permease [Ignavibacteriales bacterium]